MQILLRGHLSKCISGGLLNTYPLNLTPVLPPHELEVLAPGEVLLDGVVRALDEHRVEPDPLLQVRHRRRQTERVDRPTHAAEEKVIQWLLEHMWY